MTTIKIKAPEGKCGLAVEPWSAGEIYAVAANWAQASDQVMQYGPRGWTGTQYQVAEFRHSPQAALAQIVREAIQAGGDEPDDDEVDGIVSDAVEIDGRDEE